MTIHGTRCPRRASAGDPIESALGALRRREVSPNVRPRMCGGCAGRVAKVLVRDTTYQPLDIPVAREPEAVPIYASRAPEPAIWGTPSVKRKGVLVHLLRPPRASRPPIWYAVK